MVIVRKGFWKQDVEKVSETKLEMEVDGSKSRDPETRKMTASIWQQSCELWPTAAMHQIWSLMKVSRRQTIEAKSVLLYSRLRPSHPVRKEKIVWAHGKQSTTVCSVFTKHLGVGKSKINKRPPWFFFFYNGSPVLLSIILVNRNKAEKKNIYININ